MDLKKELGILRDQMWVRAQEFFAEQKQINAGMGDFIEVFLDNLHQSLQGGKAVRGNLVCYGAISCNGSVTKDLIDLALAMEMFHTYLLIHDDIIDKDALRRGKPAFHTLYKDLQHTDYIPQDRKHFGISMAIMAGDMLSALAYQLICQTNFSADVKNAINLAVSETLFQTGAGEILDVLNDLKVEQDRQHLMKVHTLKTARYTFLSPLKIGAFAANATQDQHFQLEQYALPIGIAFQLHDDLLGLFGEASKLGKPVFSDLREGKQTLLIMEAYKRGTQQQKKTIDHALGNAYVTIAQGEEVKRIVKDTGAYDYSKRLAETFKEDALRGVQGKHLTPKGKQFLTHLAEYIVSREY